MKRRDFLESMLIAPVFLLSSRSARGPAADASVRLRPGDAGPTVNPHLYGHFIEHLGGVIYDGIWVGPDSKIPNIHGIRKQFTDDMKRIAAPNIRWPGGCFADGYHWRDGIGSVEQRPRTYNFWQSYMPRGVDATETNHFGTHEFFRLCELMSAEPYLSGNVTSSSPKELHDWVSYCNSPLGTVSLAEERKANGHPEPFRVRYWGIGNESWGCGGNFKPDEYATVYRRFATQFPKYTKPFLIAAGPNRDDFNWTRGFFGNIAPDRLHLVDGWALHYYTHRARANSPAVDFTPDQWYRILHAGSGIEKVIEDQWDVMGEFDKDHRVKFVIDEWGTWHLPGDEIDPSYLFGQMKTLRDALHAAVTLDIFHRHTKKIAMANISEAVNSIDPLFLAKGSHYVRTPVYYVFEMYRPHQGGRLVPMEIQAHDLEYSGPNGATKMFGLAGSASIQDRRLTVTLVNPSLDAPIETAILMTQVLAREAKATALTHTDMRAANTFDAPDQVVPESLAVSLSGDRINFSMPKQSVVALQVLLG